MHPDCCQVSLSAATAREGTWGDVRRAAAIGIGVSRLVLASMVGAASCSARRHRGRDLRCFAGLRGDGCNARTAADGGVGCLRTEADGGQSLDAGAGRVGLEVDWRLLDRNKDGLSQCEIQRELERPGPVQ